jgi:tetratricopeptide (TPR) repeat protein
MMQAAPEGRPSNISEIADALRSHLGQGTPQRAAIPAAQSASTDGGLTPVGVVVLPFDCRGDDDDSHHWLGQALSDHLTRALASRGQIFVAEAEPFLATVQRVSPRFPNDQIGQWREAGRLSGAAFVIAGHFSYAGDSLEIQVEVHSSTKAQPSCEETFSGQLTKLVELEEDLYRFAAQAIGVEGSAVPDAPASGRSAELEAKFFAAKQAFQRGDYEVAMQRAKSAHESAPQDGDILGLIGICYARMGQYDEAVSYHERQHALAVSANDARQRVEAHANLGSMYYFKGEFPAADRWLTQAADAAESHGYETELALIRNNLGYVRLQLGRLESAEEAYQTAIRIHRRHGALTQLIGPYNGIGHILLKRERYEEARSYFQRALSLSQQSSDQVNMGVAYMNLGYCAVELGELQSAKHELAIALNVLEYTTFWNGLARVYDYMVRLNTRLNHWTEALRCAEQRITLAKRHKNEKIEADAREQYEQTARLAAGSSR